MMKRILSFLLAFLMVVSIFPTPAHATDSTDVTITLTETPTEAATETPCGTCGQLGCTSEHLNWCADCQKDDCGQNHCDTCGAIDCTTEHKICDKCGTLDCTADHTNWCADCKVDNCGQNHCPTCRAIDCTKEHKACETCSVIDCTADHTNWCDICKFDNCGKDHSGTDTQTEDPSSGQVDAVSEDETTDPLVGRTATFNTDSIWLYSAPGALSQLVAKSQLPASVVITEVNGDYYRVDAANGAVWPSDYEQSKYVKSSVLTLDQEKAPCPVCGQTDCTTEHKQCEICGKYECDCPDEKPLTDTTQSGVEILVKGDIPEGVTLEAKEQDVTQIPDFPWEMYGLSSENYTLDLTLWNGSEKWQPGQPVEVSVPASALGFAEGEQFIALHRHTESNGETYMEALGPYYVKDGFATVTMNAFSTITYISKDKTMRIDGVGAFFRAYSAWTGNHNYVAVGVYADTDGNIHVLMEGSSNNTPHKELEYVTIIHNPKDNKEDWKSTQINTPSSEVVAKVSAVNAYNADGELVGHLTPNNSTGNTWYWDINLGPIDLKGDFGIVVKTTTGQEGNSFNTGDSDTGGQPVEIRIFYDIQKTVYSINGNTNKSGDDVVLEEDDKGKEVIYQIVVSNFETSETDLQGIIVTDLLPDIFHNGTIQVGTTLENMTEATVTDGKLTLATDLILAPGKNQVYYVRGVLMEDLPVGKHDNIATVSGKLVEGDSDPSGIIVPPEKYGSLKISKTVRVPEGADYTAPEQSFTFTVIFQDTETVFGYQVFATGSSDVIRSGSIKSGGTLELAHNQYAVIDHVTPGSYTVTETAAENFKANQSTYTGQIVNQQQSVADYVNTYTLPQGDLLIAKFVEYGEYAPADTDRTFEFTVTLPVAAEGTNTYSYEIKSYGEGPIPSAQDVLVQDGRLELDINNSATFTLKHRQYILIKNVLIGNYTLTESKIDAYETPMYYYDNASVHDYSTTGTIVGGMLNQVMCYNYPVKYPGDLSITKNVEVLNEHAQAPVQRFEFSVFLTNVPNLDNYGTAPAEESGDVLEEEIRKYRVTYTVTEGKGTLSGYQYTLNEETVTLQETVELMPDVDGYSFTIGLYDGLTATIEDLPPCGYEVFEEDYSAQSFRVKWSEGKKGLLGGPIGSVASVTCTNTYGVTTGDLNIRKNVKIEYARDTIPEATFNFVLKPAEGITLEGSYDLYIGTTKVGDAVAQNDNTLPVSIRFEQSEMPTALNDAAIKVLTIKHLPMGNYTVQEILDSDSSGNTDDDDFKLENMAETYSQSTTVGTNTQTVVFTNEYRRHLGRLTINKTVTGGKAGDTFLFHISGNGLEMDVTVQIGQDMSGSVTVYDLPLGQYTVTEDTDWSWRYTVDADAKTANLTVATPDSTVAFTNTYTNNQWLNHVIHVLNKFVAGSN